MKEKELLAEEILEEARKDGDEITYEDALEMAEMEIKARQIKRYEKSDTPKKKAIRERKIDYEKKNILDSLIDGFMKKYSRAVKVKPESEFSFTFNESEYTVKLIKHRPPKK